MKNFGKLGALALVLVGMMFASCTKNDDNTIVLIGEELYIDDILTVIPDTLKPAFNSFFGAIPDGPVPPDIEGSYVVDPKQRISTNVSDWPLTVVEPNVYLKFTDQNNGVVTMDLNEATEQMTDTVFVRGAGKDFSVYFVENKSYDLPFLGQTYRVRVKRGIIMKGTVVSNGLANFAIASIIMEAEDNSQGLLDQYAPGSFFVYRDGDSMAENFEW
ncbi:MAG: hypothetical protein K6G25_09930 [Bacteroidales bacterium]|nr:hypothetical protein [Bacteroidales bacterium]